MIFLKFKKLVLHSENFRKIDCCIRILANKILLIFIKRRCDFNIKQFVFILHGGMGDIILQKSLINKIANEKNVLVIMDKKMEFLESIFINSEIIFYSKDTFFQDLKIIQKKIHSNSVLIHTSPILEIHLMRIVLKIKASFGLAHSFQKIKKFNGVIYSSNSINKLEIYDDVYEQLFN